MTSYLDPWPVYFLLISIIFIILVNIIRVVLGRKMPTWRLIGHILGFWLGSYALFFIFDSLTYRGGTIDFIRMQETINAIIVVGITGSLWYTLTSETTFISPIPITLIIMGILSLGYGFVNFPPHPWDESSLFWIRSVLVYLGFGIFLIIMGIIAGLITLINIRQNKQPHKIHIDGQLAQHQAPEKRREQYKNESFVIMRRTLKI